MAIRFDNPEFRVRLQAAFVQVDSGVLLLFMGAYSDGQPERGPGHQVWGKKPGKDGEDDRNLHYLVTANTVIAPKS